MSALSQLAFTTTLSQTDRDVIDQRQAQMILFLESILPCLDEIVEEEYELSMIKDDTEEVRAIFDDESLWTIVDSDLQREVAPSSSSPASPDREYECGICGQELTNTYKQCLGCTMYARHSRPNKAYNIFRICMRCHSEAERHHFKPRAIHAYYEKLLCSEGHTGLLRATRRYQAERSYFKCRCALGLRCVYCGGCESCSCLCHTLFQTRFRHCSPGMNPLRGRCCRMFGWRLTACVPVRAPFYYFCPRRNLEPFAERCRGRDQVAQDASIRERIEHRTVNKLGLCGQKTE